MKVLIAHLTRMQRGYICMAGFDLETMRQVRPGFKKGVRLTTDFLARHGGPLDMARVIDVGPATPHPVPPHVEDHHCNLYRAKVIQTIEDAEFWQLLRTVAGQRLRDIFGQDLIKAGPRSLGVAPGKGRCSLGCLSPRRRPELYLQPRQDRRDQVRMRFRDAEHELDVSVTDIRLYGEDHVTPDKDVVQRIARRLKEPGPIVLCMGLTRAMASDPKREPVCWLQVNNIHLPDSPTWQLG